MKNNAEKTESRRIWKERILFGTGILIILWLVMSFFDVVNNNMSTHTYQWWNAFVLFF